jgi:hypothetical protein
MGCIGWSRASATPACCPNRDSWDSGMHRIHRRAALTGVVPVPRQLADNTGMQSFRGIHRMHRVRMIYRRAALVEAVPVPRQLAVPTGIHKMHGIHRLESCRARPANNRRVHGMHRIHKIHGIHMIHRIHRELATPRGIHGIHRKSACCPRRDSWGSWDA